MDPLKRIENMISPAMESLGYRVVRMALQGTRRPTLQVMAERIDNQAMSVEDCADISRAISPILDVEDPITGNYSLEVSSPGIDRPLVRIEDYERFSGFEARVELDASIEGRRRFTGRILGVKDGVVQLLVDGAAVDLPFEEITKAKLVLTDDLISAAAKEQRL